MSSHADAGKRGRRWRSRAVVAVLAAAWLGTAAPGRAEQEQILIFGGDDLGTLVPPVGFLHGVDHTGHVPDAALIADLRPRYWRLAKYETYEFVAPFEDVLITYSVSDPYGWSVGYPNAQPWLDWPSYENYVRAIVLTRSAWFPEHPVAFWDVWNEPDHPYFWTGTYEQLLELFARTIRAIRAVDDETPIVGPSLSCFDPASPGLENIIDFLVDLDEIHGVRLDAISWHENGSACVGGPDPRDIVQNTLELRVALLEHFGPSYQPELHINEYTGGQVHLAPGWNVGYLYNLVEAGIVAAMRACWNDCEGVPWFIYSNCWAGLSGLLMYDDVTPQTSYWVYKAVADMEGRRRLGSVGPSLTRALATRDDGLERIQVLVGRFGTGTQTDVTVELRDYPYAHETVHVDVERIPYTWAHCSGTPLNYPLPGGPLAVLSEEMPVVDGVVQVCLAGFRDAEAYTIVLDPPPCAADIDGDGSVGVSDFLALLAAWGQPGGAADVNGDGIVNIADFLEVIAGVGTVSLMRLRPSGPYHSTSITRVWLACGASPLNVLTRQVPTVVLCGAQELQQQAQRAEALRSAGVEIVGVPGAGGELSPEAALRMLVERCDVTTVLVEAGPGLLGRLFSERLVNVAWIFVAPLLFGDDEALPCVRGLTVSTLTDGCRMSLLHLRRRGDDVILAYGVT